LENNNFLCTGCQKKYSLDRTFPRCDDCFEPLEVEIAQDEISEKRNDTFSNYSLNQNILDRYASFYSLSQINQQLSLREGFTPLIQKKHAIANPYPPSVNKLLRKLRMVDGMVTAVFAKEALEF